ncbi:MAG: methionine adenosyltransferase [Acidobacteriota bacterium]|nr:methionine adenosyltransferase [Acidobacteriota bacterium]
MGSYIVVNPPAATHPDLLNVEMVERKGRGHPDTMCDALAEAFSIGLSRAYYDRCGAILHHNVDKVLLKAGSSTPAFGGGEVGDPLEIFLAGRATCVIDDVRIPVGDIAAHTSHSWLRANLHALDPDRHVRVHVLVEPGSAALTALVPRAASDPSLANDTSFGVGYWPPSQMERVVLAVEAALTSSETIAAHPVIGEDVKVMGVRRGDAIDLTVACAFVDRYLPRLAEYVDAKAVVSRLAERAALEIARHRVRVTVNAADDPASGRVYLTVTGTSAESGDDGEVGRGNRVGGLIAPYRPATQEAAAGKNVVSHAGKTYNIVAHQIAKDIVSTHAEVAEAACFLASRIGWPVETPQLVDLRIRTHDDLPLDTIRERVQETASNGLRGLARLPQLLLDRASIESPAAWPGIPLF